jgi:hypothetical protein
MVGAERAVASKAEAAVADASCEQRPATAVSNMQIVNKSSQLKYLMGSDSVHQSSILQYNPHP